MTSGYIRIKWASANMPYIEFDQTGQRIYPSKRELLEMLAEITEFVEYYKDNFEESRLDYRDE
jgi:hypothetical protein